MNERLFADAALRGARYLDEIRSRRVFPEARDVHLLRDALKAPLPAGPTPPEEVLAMLDELGAPATVACAGGRYFGFVTGGALPASAAAHVLATAWDQNAFSMTASPAAALFEEAALRWIREALALPEGGDGAFVVGATAANFTGLAAARHAVLAKHGWDVERRGLRGAPAVAIVVGDEVHGTVNRVLSLLGFGRDEVLRVPVDAQGRMRAGKMPGLDGPAIVCIQAGNVNSGAFDPAAEIIDRAQAAGAWVHVDGAFGLWARASARLAPLAAGFERADSWATDAHKWLNVPYDCGVAFVRDPAALRAAMSIRGDYLLLGRHRDVIDITLDGSRRARGIDAWAALRQLGKSGLAGMIERHCEQAARLAGELARAGFEVLNEVVLNQVVVSFGDDARTRRTIERLQQDGDCWCGGTRWRGREAMRISISSWATTDEDLRVTLAAIVRAARGA